MPSKRNWQRDYDLEDEDRTVKYAWRHRKFSDYVILVIDMKKELGRYHQDYREEERYAIDIEKDTNLIDTFYEKTVNTAYNMATDLQEDYPDARDLHLELGNEDEQPDSQESKSFS